MPQGVLIMKFTAEDFARYKRAELDRAAMFKAMTPLRRDLPPGPALVCRAPTIRENLKALAHKLIRR